MIIKAQTQCKLYHHRINRFINYIEDFVGVQTLVGLNKRQEYTT